MKSERLAIFNMKDEVIVIIDASPYVIGVKLCNSHLKTVLCGFATFSHIESLHSHHEKESLALILLLKIS